MSSYLDIDNNGVNINGFLQGQGTTSVAGYVSQISTNLADVNKTTSKLDPETAKETLLDIFDKYGFEIVLNNTKDNILKKKGEEFIGWIYGGDLDISQKKISWLLNTVFKETTYVEYRFEIIAKSDVYFEDIPFAVSFGESINYSQVLLSPLNSDYILHLCPDQFFNSLRDAFTEAIEYFDTYGIWNKFSAAFITPIGESANGVYYYSDPLISSGSTAISTISTDAPLIARIDAGWDAGGIN
jgi:hypothetical protein